MFYAVFSMDRHTCCYVLQTESVDSVLDTSLANGWAC